MFVLSSGMYSLATFFRMYIMAMFWCSLLTYFLVRQLSEEKITGKFFIEFILIVTAGALTHYYCILYAVLISIVFCTILIGRRSYRDLGRYIAASAISGTLTIALFPPIIQHLFFGRRGIEAFTNLSPASAGYPERIAKYLHLMDDYVFGRLLVPVLIACALFMAFGIKHQKEGERNKGKIQKYIVSSVPSILFFFLISKTAPYLIQRYMCPVYGIVLVSSFSCLFDQICRIGNRRKVYAIMALVLLAVSGNELRVNDWQYLRYTNARKLTGFAREHKGLDCVLVYPTERLYGNAHAAFSVIKDYRSITFIREDHLEELLYGSELIEKSELILLVLGRKTEIMEDVLKHCPKMNDSTRLGMYIYSTVYHLHP